jgi:hypothetical protein
VRGGGKEGAGAALALLQRLRTRRRPRFSFSTRRAALGAWDSARRTENETESSRAGTARSGASRQTASKLHLRIGGR